MPTLYLINGPMGAGKSTLANIICKQIPNPIYYLKIDDLKSYAYHLENEKDFKDLIFEISKQTVTSCLKKEVDVVVEKALNVDEVKEIIQIGDYFGAIVIPILLLPDLVTTKQRVLERRRMTNLVTSSEYWERVERSYEVALTLRNIDDRQIIITDPHLNPEAIMEKVIKS